MTNFKHFAEENSAEEPWVGTQSEKQRIHFALGQIANEYMMLCKKLEQDCHNNDILGMQLAHVIGILGGVYDIDVLYLDESNLNYPINQNALKYYPSMIRIIEIFVDDYCHDNLVGLYENDKLRLIASWWRGEDIVYARLSN